MAARTSLVGAVEKELAVVFECMASCLDFLTSQWDRKAK